MQWRNMIDGKGLTELKTRSLQLNPSQGPVAFWKYAPELAAPLYPGSQAERQRLHNSAVFLFSAQTLPKKSLISPFAKLVWTYMPAELLLCDEEYLCVILHAFISMETFL